MLYKIRYQNNTSCAHYYLCHIELAVIIVCEVIIDSANKGFTFTALVVVIVVNVLFVLLDFFISV